MRAWVKRKASSPSNSAWSAPIRPWRASATRRARSSSPLGLGEHRGQRAGMEGPALDGRRAAAASARPGRAGRCAPRAPPGCSPAARSWPGRLPTATSCSTNSGLPSARVAICPARSPAPRRAASSRPRRPRVRRARGWSGWVGAPTRPGATQQLGPRQAEQQDRRAGRQRGDVVEQVQQRGLGPVDVLDRDDERAIARQPLEQPPQRPRRLLGLRGLVREPDRGEDAAHGRLVAGQQLLDVRARVGAEPAHEVGERAVRRALAVGEAAAREHGGVVAERAEELPRQSRLADPRRSGDRDEPADALRAGLGERGAQLVELGLAPDERRLGRAQQRRLLEPQLSSRPVVVVDARVRRDRRPDLLAEQDLALARALGEAARGGDRRAGGDRGAARSGGEEDLAGLDARAAARRSRRAARRPPARRAARRRRGTDQAEEADERVAEIALDGPAVAARSPPRSGRGRRAAPRGRRRRRARRGPRRRGAHRSVGRAR